MKKHFRWIFLALALASFGVSIALADTVDFTSYIPGTTPTTPAYFGSTHDFGAFRVTAYTFNGGWATSTLTGRNDTGAPVSDVDHGVGVCSQGNNGCTGVFNINEIDSINANRTTGAGMELLQIGLVTGDSTKWSNITFSSLDLNGQLSEYVTGEVFYGDLGPGGTLSPTSFATLLCSFNYDFANPVQMCKSPLDHTGLPEFDAKLTFQNPVMAKYLYVWAPLRPADETNGAINDFLVRGVTADVPQPPPPDVPEPSSLVLLATGLGGASLGIRRKFRG